MPGEAFPLETIAQAIAARLGERGAPLAARVPLLREAVSEQLVAAFARKNALLAAAIWIPRADLPVLALNEFRLVLRLAQAYGAADDPPERLPELAATLGAGFGLRALARQALCLAPGAGWPVKVAVAYAGRVRSARPRASASSLRLRRRSRPEPRAPRLDGAQALRQTRPGPRLDLVVAVLRLAPSHLEVLEPRISFFDLQELFGFAFRHHRSPPGRELAGS